MTITETRNELAPPEGRRRIVVGFDGSDSSIKALDWAIAEAAHAPAVIDVVTSGAISATWVRAWSTRSRAAWSTSLTVVVNA